ncbi:hypothetical protein PybrP1_002195 [[Pythium] brassicae (nom. inval.)]|nr:hypothetical protein PybrP1_002195 [[Pythium] brassicae (nom. inval.)]
MANDTSADVFARALRGATSNDSTPASSSPHHPSSNGLGGFLVCLDVPVGTEFGVDYEVFRTGTAFRGVKFLPLGLHLVVFRARDQRHGVRQGFFLNVTRSAQLIVREWSAEKEELGPPRAGLNLEHLERAVLSFQLDSGLGAYPMQHYRTWTRLTKFVSGSVLQRCGVEYGALILPGDSDPLSVAEGQEDTSVAPFFPDLPRTVRFTPLLQKRKKQSAQLSASERTQYHFDRSTRLEELLAHEFDGRWEELVGEFQLAFVVFLQLSSLAALEQWKQFVSLLSACDRALHTQLPLFRAFLKTFQTQLAQVPEDFFEDASTGDNFLRPCFESLFELLGDADAPPQLERHARQLRELVQTRFRLDASALGSEEFAPVVVPEAELMAALSLQSDGGRASDEAAEDRANAAIAAAFLRG